MSRRAVWIGLGGCALFAALAALAWGWQWLEMERLLGRDLTPSALAATSIVTDRAGRTLGEIYVERRRPVTVERLPAHVLQAFLAAEDDRFFQHRGIDPLSVARALWTNLRAGRIEQGASTITQQTVRALFLGVERSWRRKLSEAVLALRLEARLPKRDILTLYLNTVYFGAGAHGLGEAAHTFYAKAAADLTVSEAAQLAGILPRPSDWNPLRDPAAAEARRRRVLRRMAELGYLSPAEALAARAEAPRLARAEGPPASAGWVVEEVKRTLEARYGARGLARRGLRIETTIDLRLQRAAGEALRAGLEAWEDGRGQAPGELQGALVALDVESCEVLAWVGGRDFGASYFDRVSQARRQPGSAFKSFVYAAALEAGYTGASLLTDAPVVRHAGGSEWTPHNRGLGFQGRVTLREALARSLNTPAIRVAQRLGMERVADLAWRLGIASPLATHLSLALGTSPVSLLELTGAYAAFPRGGLTCRPTLIRRVVDRGGREEAPPAPAGGDERALDAATAAVMVDLLRAPIRDPHGTASRARSLALPVAGKTGTSDGALDAWFVGFSPRVAAGVWVGYDRSRGLGRGASGGRTALPIWRELMRAAHDAEDGGELRFESPPDVVRVAIDRQTGLRARPGARDAFVQAFRRGTAPERRVEDARAERVAKALLRADWVATPLRPVSSARAYHESEALRW